LTATDWVQRGTVRAELEAAEARTLAPWAAKAAHSAGRGQPEPVDPGAVPAGGHRGRRDLPGPLRLGQAAGEPGPRLVGDRPPARLAWSKPPGATCCRAASPPWPKQA